MNIFTFLAGFLLSVSLVSAIAVPNPFQRVHGSSMTMGNSLLSPFTHSTSFSFDSSSAAATAPEWMRTYDQSSNIFPTVSSANQAAAPFATDHMATESTAATTPLLESSMVQRFELIPRKGLTPSVTYYLPTGKCPKNYYCRAEMTIYKEFSGATAIGVGYSVWHFVDPNGPIPSGTLNRIMATTTIELRRYLSILTHATYPDYPYRNDLCRYDFGVGVAEFRKVLTEMSACTSVTDGICRKTEVVKRC